MTSKKGIFTNKSQQIGNVLCVTSIHETPIDKVINDDQKGEIKSGPMISMTINEKSDIRYSAFFLHILDKKSALYSEPVGFRDGDVIVRINGLETFPATSLEEKQIVRMLENGGCKVTVARPNNNDNNDHNIRYQILEKTVPTNCDKFHVHKHQLTEKEHNTITKYKNK